MPGSSYFSLTLYYLSSFLTFSALQFKIARIISTQTTTIEIEKTTFMTDDASKIAKYYTFGSFKSDDSLEKSCSEYRQT